MADGPHDAPAEPDRLVAPPLHRRRVVADEDHRLAALPKVREARAALRGERLVSHGQGLVDQEDVGIEVNGHREPQAHEHARRVGSRRLIDELPDVGELDDLVEAIQHLVARQAEQHAADRDVLAAGELRVKAGAQLDEGGHPARDADGPGVGPINPGDEPEQGALPGAVLTDDAEGLSPRDREVDAVERLEAVVAQQPPAPESVDDRGLQRPLPPPRAQAEPLAHAPELDGRWRHTSSTTSHRQRA
jgi:hypothetical protein